MITITEGEAQHATQVSGWHLMPAIPDEIGFAGAFAGLSHGKLIVAGGANFPDGGAPWTGAVKRWTNKVFILDRPDGKWHLADPLPDSLGYGGSISYNNQLIFIGGSNEHGHSATVQAMEWKDGTVSNRKFPDLPTPIANTTAVLLDNFIYVAGGIRTADARQAEHNFWRLNLQQTEKGWEVLENWPGAPRMLSVMGVHDSKIYLVSGVELINGERHYLHDGFCYQPGKGWKKIADLPVAVAAAPSPALTLPQGLLIAGGDDGKLASQAAVLKDKHPGFSNRMLMYNPALNVWTDGGSIAACPVTTTAVDWNGLYVIPGGEIRPAVRTNGILVRLPSCEGGEMP